jgi:ATP-dependent DNA helicase RecQ
MGHKANVLESTLKRHFGLDSFRPGQRDVIKSIVAGRNVFAVMPTGAGKSLCYQLPALLGQGLTLVVSPLIALMKDQVDGLSELGIPATFINSQVHPHERELRSQAMIDGQFKLVYVAPERFRDEHFVAALRQCPIDRLAVDEAHCVSVWGHDFRPDYRRLPAIVKELSIPQICAFTATATPEVRTDIADGLGIESPDVFIHGFARENLKLRVIHVVKLNHRLTYILELIAAHTTGSGIIYASTRKNVEKVALYLKEQGVKVGTYHGGMSEKIRNVMQDEFMDGTLRVMVATNAFGMGIDKADIRFVIHHNMPGSLEAYYQEAGRAGRDGEDAECVMLFNYVDTRIHEFFIERIGDTHSHQTGRAPSPESIDKLKLIERSKLRRMCDYCYTDLCRHQLILNYFGESLSADFCQSHCDLCDKRQGVPAPNWAHVNLDNSPKNSRKIKKPKATILSPPQEAKTFPSDHETVVLQKLLSAVARSRGRLSNNDLISLVRGKAKTTDADLLASKSMGILKDQSTAYIKAIVAELRNCGALAASKHSPKHRILTPLGAQIMTREVRVKMALPQCPTKPVQPVPSSDPALFDALVTLRRQLATEEGVAPFMVAHNTLLEELARTKPVSHQALQQVRGIGPAKAKRYGDHILSTIEKFRSPTLSPKETP